MRKRRWFRSPPQELVFKDERALGPMSVRGLTRLVLIAVATGFVIFAVLLLVMISQFSNGRAQRLENQQKTQQQIQELACLADSYIPPGNELGDKLREQYDCPPYQQPTSVPTFVIPSS